MANLKNHGGRYWLRDDAAAAFDRMEAERGFIDLNDAGRTEGQQQELINRWNRGGSANRPPYLYQPAMPASASNHVRGGGLAFDTSDWRRVKEFAHLYGFKWLGNSDPVHFDYVGGGSGGSTPSGNQVTKDRQNWLNSSRGAGLAVDGIEGPATKQAYKNYQSFLGVAADGVWGPATQAAHQRYYDSMNQPAPSNPSAGVPSGLPWVGIQKMLKGAGYGYTGAIDGIAGSGTVSAFQRFLNANGHNAGGVDGVWGPATAKAAQRWLAARWGYRSGIDGDFGPGTRASWAEAERQNSAAF